MRTDVGRTICLTTGVVLSVLWTGVALAQRNYDVQWTSTPPTIDGVVTAGEWDSASPAAGDWGELRLPSTEMDTDNNRFRILYDAENLYFLFETDYDFGWLPDLGGGNPGISFNDENLNLYIDPNRDGDLNQNPTTGMPSDPNAAHDVGVDGYQVAFNLYEGTHISTDTDRQGIGFFTEAHVNTPFGDQAGWNQGLGDTAGGALTGSGIVVAQQNTNPSGGVAEIKIPFADLDAPESIAAPAPNADYNGDGTQDAADYTLWRDTYGEFVGTFGDGILDGADGNDDGQVNDPDYDLWKSGFGRTEGAMLPTGLNATDGASAGEVWGFNMSMITRDSENYLPIWNWHNAGGFALWPHGTLTFQAPVGVIGPGAGVPEPGTLLLVALATLTGASVGRRRTGGR